METFKIAVTGHRPNKLNNEYDGEGTISASIKIRMQQIIDEYFEKSMDGLTLISGMALGVDMLWAERAIANQLPFIAAIPCLNHPAKWPAKSQARYNYIIGHKLCAKVMVTNKPYTWSCMQKRNVWMVDNCDLLVAVWDGTPGGTKNCVDYASYRKPIIQINPKML